MNMRWIASLLGVAAIGTALPTPVIADEKVAKEKTESKEKADKTKYSKVETKAYTVEVPEGWEVGEETPFGQREILPKKPEGLEKKASMSTMTGPGLGRRSWEDLYKTSLYFIMRYRSNEMKPQPYKLGKSKQGFESCSWTMTNKEGKPIQRHVILKSPNGNILAMSVKIPSEASKEKLDSIFQHMVETATVR